MTPMTPMPMDLLESLLIAALMTRQVLANFGPFLLVGLLLAGLLNLRRWA